MSRKLFRIRLSTVLAALVFAVALTTYLLVRPIPAMIAHNPDNPTGPGPATSQQSTPSLRPETASPRPTEAASPSVRPVPSRTPSTHPTAHASTPVALSTP